MAQVTVRRGDDERFLLTFKKVDGTIRDLTGCTVFFTVKPSYPATPSEDLTDASAFLSYYWVHDGSTVTDSYGFSLPDGATAGDGQLVINFPRSLTTTWAKINQYYEIQVTLPDADGEDGEVDDTWDSGDFQTVLDLHRRRTP